MMQRLLREFLSEVDKELDKFLNEPEDIKITMPSITVSTNTQVNLLATPVDSNGVATTDSNPISFKNDNPSGANLIDNGNGTASVVPSGPGTTNVTATDGTITSSQPFTIIVQAAGGPGAVADIVISQV